MVRHFWALAVVVAACVLLACGEDERAVQVDWSRRENITAPAPENVLTYAYLPQYSHAVSFARHGGLVRRLQQATGLPLLQVYPNTFDEHVKMVERREIDISFSNPFIYIQLAEAGARAFARVVEKDGEPGFRGQIIRRKDDRSIRTLADCRGKRWIAVDPLSAGGYLFALGMFMDHGLDRSDFAEIAFAPGPGGKQEKVVLAVYSGKYDIGSIREGTLEVVGDRVDREALTVLATTPLYPGWVFARRKGLDPRIAQRIGQAMFELSGDEAGRDILHTAGIRGIIPADDADYDPIRALAAKVGLE